MSIPGWLIRFDSIASTLWKVLWKHEVWTHRNQPKHHGHTYMGPIDVPDAIAIEMMSTTYGKCISLNSKGFDHVKNYFGRGRGPAGNTECRWSRLRSGLEHWAQMVAVEVRQGTLSADDRGCRLTLDMAVAGWQETKEDEEEGRGRRRGGGRRVS